MKIAAYCRVSSDEQRDNQTIQTQIDAAAAWLAFQAAAGRPCELVDSYLDDGVSGTIDLARRPEGARFMADAAAGRFQMVIVYKVDRLGREPRDILNAAHRIDQLGVAVKALTEEFDLSTPAGRFMFNMLAANAGFARDTLIERSVAGTTYWARQGVWLGGIVPFGYRVEGTKKSARLVVNDATIPGQDLSEPDVVRLIYRLLVDEGRSCVQIAEHLNALGIPPVYVRDGRHGKRQSRVTGYWAPGRIRNLVVNPVYKGLHHYGRRSKKPREVIARAVPAIVTPVAWDAAQAALARNRLMVPRASIHRYLLRGLIRCELCGLTFGGTDARRPNGRREHYYRCNGKQPFRGRLVGRCPSKAVPAAALEAQVWADIEEFLRDPAAVAAACAADLGALQAAAPRIEDDLLAAGAALERKQRERDAMLDLYRRDVLTDEDLSRQLRVIAAEQEELRRRVGELEARRASHQRAAGEAAEVEAWLAAEAGRLGESPSWEQRRRLVEQLVREIRVGLTPEGKVRVDGTYRFRRAPVAAGTRDEWCATLIRPLPLS